MSDRSPLRGLNLCLQRDRDGYQMIVPVCFFYENCLFCGQAVQKQNNLEELFLGQNQVLRKSVSQSSSMHKVVRKRIMINCSSCPSKEGQEEIGLN